MTLDQLRKDSARKQKKGIHFIIASVIIWVTVFLVHSSALPIDTKNLLTFCATAPLMPLAYGISKMLNIDFTNKDNPLTNLGLLFSINQLLYLLIAMWIMNHSPQHLVMVLAMIFGAHLLPYAWLYQSVSYKVLSVLIPLASLLIGLLFDAESVALLMIIIEVLFVISLTIEVKQLQKQTT